MARPKSITVEQIEAVVRLYVARKHSIKQIMKETGVRSEQTIYRILDESGVPRYERRATVKKATISFDGASWDLIQARSPRNLSLFICNLIKDNL